MAIKARTIYEFFIEKGLLVTALFSIIAVFFIIAFLFSTASELYIRPTPEYHWVHGEGPMGEVTVLSTADLYGNGDDVVLVGTEAGEIYLYDCNSLEPVTTAPFFLAGGPIRSIETGRFFPSGNLPVLGADGPDDLFIVQDGPSSSTLTVLSNDGVIDIELEERSTVTIYGSGTTTNFDIQMDLEKKEFRAYWFKGDELHIIENEGSVEEDLLANMSVSTPGTMDELVVISTTSFADHDLGPFTSMDAFEEYVVVSSDEVFVVWDTTMNLTEATTIRLSNVTGAWLTDPDEKGAPEVYALWENTKVTLFEVDGEVAANRVLPQTPSLVYFEDNFIHFESDEMIYTHGGDVHFQYSTKPKMSKTFHEYYNLTTDVRGKHGGEDEFIVVAQYATERTQLNTLGARLITLSRDSNGWTLHSAKLPYVAGNLGLENYIGAQNPWTFITAKRWAPHRDTEVGFGAAPLITATIFVTMGSMIFAIPLGIASAIFLSQLCPKRIRGVLKFIVEVLAGIPSVVYGLFGLALLTNWIRIGFDKPTGETLLAGSILLAIMALPTIISVSEDAISAVGKDLKEGSLALGATKWQTISRVLVPSAMSGITAAVILGMGRAMGETMAVMMVTGNAPQFPAPLWDIFTPVRPITATLAIEMGETAVGSMHYYSLFALAVVLFFMTLIVNMTSAAVLGNYRKTQMGVRKDTGKKRINVPSWVKPVVQNIGVGLILIFILMLTNAWFGQTTALVIVGVLTIIYVLAKLVPKHISSKILLGMFVLLILFLTTQWFGWIIGGGLTGLILTVLVVMKFVPPKYSQYVAYAFVTLAMVAVLISVGVILYFVVFNGIQVISPEFLLGIPEDDGSKGGIFPAIVGTLYLTVGAIVLALPIGIAAGIYLSEYAKEGPIMKIVRGGIDNLNGTPSIVFGLFGLAFFVLYLDMGTSIIAGSMTLALMILPTIIRTTEESLKNVPQSVREGSLALGATKLQTIIKVVLPPAMPGIITGTILSFGRAAGETAPILFTAAVGFQRVTPMPWQLDSNVMAMPYHIYYLSKETSTGQDFAFGTSLVLVVFVLTFYSIAGILRYYFSKKMKW